MNIRINTTSAKDGTEIMEIMVGDNTYRMNSLYRPHAEAEKYAAQFAEHTRNSVLIVFGFGNGIFPDAIMNACGNKGKIIFYEPSQEIMNYAQKQWTTSDWIPKQDIFLVSPKMADKENGFYSISEFPFLLENVITYSNYKEIQYLALPKYREIFSEEYRNFEEQVQYRIRRLQTNIATAKDMGHVAVMNNIMNLQYVPDSYCADSFRNVFPEDMPAIIVSAGPSLEKNVHVLQKAKDHALILCVDTAVRYLLKENIIPDFMVSVDAVKPLTLFDDKRISEIPVVVSSDVNYQVLERLKQSQIIFAGTENTYIKSLYQAAGHTIDKLQSGGSVATFAFSLCIDWGFHNIILVGQDLALAGEQMYAGNVMLQGDDNRERIEVEDINGNRVFTYSDYYSYLMWFEQMIAMHPEIEVIDATEGGAKIHGSRIRSLESALEQYAKHTCDIGGRLASVPPAFDEAQKKKLVDKIHKSMDDLENLHTKLVKGIELTKQGIALTGKRIVDLPQCRQLDDQIQEICEYYNSLDESFLIQREIDATELELFLTIFEQKENQTKKEQYERLKAYFECLLRAEERVMNEYSKLVGGYDGAFY